MSNDIQIPWPKRESWTVAEAACLFARVDPPITNRTAFEAELEKNADLNLMYRELKDATIMGTIVYFDPGGWYGYRRIAPRVCLAWAAAKELAIPELLQELSELLPAPVGFEIDPDMYAEELDVALITYRAVTQRIRREAPDRQARELIAEWLGEHYPNLTAAARERIATVCNWDKTGGRPKAA